MKIAHILATATTDEEQKEELFALDGKKVAAVQKKEEPSKAAPTKEETAPALTQAEPSAPVSVDAK